MNLQANLAHIRSIKPISFAETIGLIATYYDYRPTEFTNGISDPLFNPAGQNEGSCKIFAFAKLHALSEAQTLNLFGDYYQEVLGDPLGTGHENIRRFMLDGWAGILFHGEALTVKP